MLLLIILAGLFFIELLAVTWYTIVKSSDMNKKTVKYKLLCSGIYIAAFLLCGAIYKSHLSLYFLLLGAGLILSFIGDITSEVSKKEICNSYFLTHSLSSLVYSSAFISFSLTEIGIKPSKLLWLLPAIPLTIFLIPFMCRPKGKFNPLLAISVFSGVITLNSGFFLGILCFKQVAPLMQSGSCALILGAGAVSFARLLQTRQQVAVPPPHKPQMPKNSSYFFGQMILACSLMITSF